LNKTKYKLIDILKNNYKREYISFEERAEGRWLNEGVHLEESVPLHDTIILETTCVGIDSQQIIKYGLKSVKIEIANYEFLLSDGSLVIAAITSCTNTSNPSVMKGAGLIAKNAIKKRS